MSPQYSVPSYLASGGIATRTEESFSGDCLETKGVLADAESIDSDDDTIT